MISRDPTQLALVATKMATITTAEARKISSLPASYLSFVSSFLTTICFDDKVSHFTKKILMHNECKTRYNDR